MMPVYLRHTFYANYPLPQFHNGSLLWCRHAWSWKKEGRIKKASRLTMRSMRRTSLLWVKACFHAAKAFSSTLSLQNNKACFPFIHHLLQWLIQLPSQHIHSQNSLLVERQTRDWMFVSSNPCRSGKLTLCADSLFGAPVHPHVTTVALKKPWSFCKKCRWQVTPKHIHILDPTKLEGADYATVQA